MDEIRVPLLANSEEELAEGEADEMEGEEGIEIRYHMQNSSGKAASDSALGERVCLNISLEDDELVGVEGGLGVEVPGEQRRRKRKKQYSGSEMIVAVFVVAFDTKRG